MKIRLTFDGQVQLDNGFQLGHMKLTLKSTSNFGFHFQIELKLIKNPEIILG